MGGGGGGGWARSCPMSAGECTGEREILFIKSIVTSSGSVQIEGCEGSAVQ